MARVKYRKYKVGRGVAAQFARELEISESHVSRVVAGERHDRAGGSVARLEPDGDAAEAGAPDPPGPVHRMLDVEAGRPVVGAC